MKNLRPQHRAHKISPRLNIWELPEAVCNYDKTIVADFLLQGPHVMDESFREQIARAASMTGEQKMRESLQIFERTARLMLDGLRDQYPELGEQELLRKLYERLAINRELEYSNSRSSK